MSQCVVIDGTPIPSDKSGYEKDQGAFRLMEIGNHPIDETETEAWNW